MASSQAPFFLATGAFAVTAHPSPRRIEAEPTSMVSNGERHNYTYQRTSEPFRVRVLPVILPDGFDAIELAESCARRGSVGR